MFLAAASVFGAGTSPALTNAAEVQALSPEQADRNLPVWLRGIVIYCDPIHGRAFLQDETGGALFRPGMRGQPQASELVPGDRIEISGVTAPGDPSTQIVGAPGSAGERPEPVEVRRLGHGPLPDPVQVSAEQLQSGAVENQYVRLRATIRTIRTEAIDGGTRLSMVLSGTRGLDGWKVPASLIASGVPDTTGWENFVADVRGVATGTDKAHEGPSRPQLLIPSVDQVVPDHDLIRRAFSQTPRRLGDIFHHKPVSPGGETPYTRVLGAVTLSRPGEGIYLGSGDRGLWVQTPQGTATRPGDQVDVIGLPGRDQRGGYLKDAVFRITGHQRLPPAARLNPAQAMTNERLAARVALEGELVDDIREAGFRWVLLDNKGRRIHARILELPPKSGATTWQTGSWLQVTGVCEPPPPLEAGGPPRFLTMLVGTQNDVVELRAAPWFTPRRVRMLIVALCAVVALAVLWVAVLHRQVARQTCVIGEQTKQRTLIEERQRMARELHDTLEQQLVGIQVRIDSANYWLPDAPAAVRTALLEARGMLDHSRAEARRSIFELRSPALDELNLPGAVRSSAGQISESGAPRIEVVTTGEEVRLPKSTEFHILRIVQEAITNAIKHSAAEEIEVGFEYTDTVLRVTIRDDGQGFDPETPATDGPYHFGLMGMRERVVRIRGRLDLTSSPEGGTTIVIEVPKHPNP